MQNVIDQDNDLNKVIINESYETFKTDNFNKTLIYFNDKNIDKNSKINILRYYVIKN